MGRGCGGQPRRWGRRGSGQGGDRGGVQLVVETVGEATWARSLAAVAAGGRVVVCGATSGPNPPAQLHRFWWKQLDVLGSTMGTRQDFLGATTWCSSGRARVHIDRVLPLSEIRAAHERLEAGEQLGKIVLSILVTAATGLRDVSPSARVAEQLGDLTRALAAGMPSRSAVIVA